MNCGRNSRHGRLGEKNKNHIAIWDNENEFSGFKRSDINYFQDYTLKSSWDVQPFSTNMILEALYSRWHNYQIEEERLIYISLWYQ